MLAISDESVDLSIGVAEVRALRLRTGEAFGEYAVRSSPPAFDLAPGAYWRRCWSSTRRGRGGETTGGTIVWGTWLREAVEPSALGYCELGRTMMGPAR